MKFSPTKYYNDTSYDYKKYWINREYEDKAERIALNYFFKFTSPKETLADIGGGFGRLIPEYAPLFKRCILVDPSEKLLRQAKKLNKKYKNLSILRGFLEKIPLKNNSLDVVITVRTLHHIKDVEKAIKEIHRILKPDGYLILEFANKIRFKNIIKNILRLNFKFLIDHLPVDIKKRKEEIPFLNYHPNQIITLLLKNNFKIIKILSVSNFRHPLIKKVIPLKILIKMERIFSLYICQFSFLKFFGPSIFILAQKR